MRGIVVVLVVAITALSVAVVAFFSVASQPQSIMYYRRSDADTVVVGVGTGTLTRIWVAGVDETSDSVAITVRSATLPLPRTGIGLFAELSVGLRQPLGDRSVIDGSRGTVLRCRGDDAGRIACLDFAPDEDPEIAVPYPLRVYTHCGLDAVTIDAETWVFEPRLTRHGAPPGLDDPYDEGHVVLTGPDAATFTSAAGVEAALVRGGEWETLECD